MSRRTHSFVWGGIVAAAFFIVGLVISEIAICSVLAVLGFTFTSSLILDNNFLGDMVDEIFSWGFVTMPGLIFELDLDGILWFLTVKLLFWILGFLLAILCGILAVTLGMVVSLFVYPFALAKNIKGEA